MNCMRARSSFASAPFRDNKARPRQFRRQLEVHQPQRLAELKMLLRFEIVGEMRRFADPAQLDVVSLVLAVGRFGGGQIGDRGEFDVELLSRRFLRRLEVGHGRLEFGDFGFERLRLGRILARHRGADFLGCGVTPLLGALQFGDRRAALLVEVDEPGRASRKAAARQGAIKSLGIVANHLYVVHGLFLGARKRGSQAIPEYVEAETRHYQNRAR